MTSKHIETTPEDYAALVDAAAERDTLRRERDMYKQLFENALKHVDECFQVCSENPNPILPDFATIGECKFRAVVRLAKEYLHLQEAYSKQRDAANRWHSEFCKAISERDDANHAAHEIAGVAETRLKALRLAHSNLVWMDDFLNDGEVSDPEVAAARKAVEECLK